MMLNPLFLLLLLLGFLQDLNEKHTLLVNPIIRLKKTVSTRKTCLIKVNERLGNKIIIPFFIRTNVVKTTKLS